MEQYFAYSCNLDYIDFTTFTGTNDNVFIRLENNAMSQTDVDSILDDLANNTPTLWDNGELRIGGTNAAPTGGASNANILILVARGWTVVL